MAFDRQQYADSLKARHAEKQSAMLPVAQLVQGAATLMDKLPRNPEWQRYCEYLQGCMERHQKRKELAKQKIEDPNVTDEQARKWRLDVFLADAAIDALKFAIELPGYITKGGQEAEEFIKRLEKKNEVDAP